MLTVLKELVLTVGPCKLSVLVGFLKNQFVWWIMEVIRWRDRKLLKGIFGNVESSIATFLFLPPITLIPHPGEWPLPQVVHELWSTPCLCSSNRGIKMTHQLEKRGHMRLYPKGHNSLCAATARGLNQYLTKGYILFYKKMYWRLENLVFDARLCDFAQN